MAIFKEILITTIDQNSILGPVSKLQYLLAIEKGSSHKLISGFSLSEANYKNAWDTRWTRYDKTKDLAIVQIGKLYNLKNRKNSPTKAIFDIIHTCNESLRILDNFKLTQNVFVDHMNIYTLTQKLNDSLKEQWELILARNKMPSLGCFLKFLEAGAKSLFALENPNEADERNGIYLTDSTNRPKFYKTQENTKCGLCPVSHGTHNCKKLLNMSLDSI